MADAVPLTQDHLSALRRALDDEMNVLKYDRSVPGQKLSAEIIGERLVREGLARALTDGNFQLTNAGVALAKTVHPIVK